MPTGTIKIYIEREGFGFITDDHLKKDIPFYEEALGNNVKIHDRVSYQISDGKKGISAVQISLL